MNKILCALLVALSVSAGLLAQVNAQPSGSPATQTPDYALADSLVRCLVDGKVHYKARFERIGQDSSYQLQVTAPIDSSELVANLVGTTLRQREEVMRSMAISKQNLSTLNRANEANRLLGQMGLSYWQYASKGVDAEGLWHLTGRVDTTNISQVWLVSAQDNGPFVGQVLDGEVVKEGGDVSIKVTNKSGPKDVLFETPYAVHVPIANGLVVTMVVDGDQGYGSMDNSWRFYKLPSEIKLIEQ